MKRKIIILLCAALLAASLAGCKDSKTDTDTITPSSYLNTSEESTGSSGFDYESAFSTFAPETVMIRADGYTVAWDELFFHIFENSFTLEYNLGDSLVWSEISHDGLTYADTVKIDSAQQSLTYKAVEYGANLSGMSLSAEDLDYMKESFVQSAAEFGGEETYLQFLWEANGCYSRELYDYLTETSVLANQIFQSLYGENGELLSDDDVSIFAAEEGFLMAKHIVLLAPDGDDETVRNEIEGILKQLDEYNGDDFDTLFDELMDARSDDQEGLVSYPNGYLFQREDMLESFYEACAALDIGEYSGVVKSELGYHIIYRVPLDFEAIPLGLANNGDYSTLRNYMALSLFDEVLSGWQDSLSITYTPEYESIDIASMFKK